MASDHPVSSKTVQPHSVPQPAPQPHPPAHSEVASPPTKASLKQWWRGFSKTSNKEPEVMVPQSQGIFGVPLRQSIVYANVAISLVDNRGKSYIYGYVPIVVAKCGVFLKEKATNVEGIFRLSGSEKRIKELKTQFDSPDRYGKGLDWDGFTVHDAANVLRRYLNQLPEPIVPLNLYEKFRQPLRDHTQQAVGDAEGTQGTNFDLDKAIATYQQLITELPPLNRQLLLYILDLLAVFASKSDENRMTSANLAAIFQPGMLNHPQHDMAPEAYRLSQDVLIFLIENQDQFLIGMSGTEADEKTVQEVQNGGTPPPGTPNTPGRKPNIARSASNASAGADSVRKYGGIRRNVSVSSRHSRQSNGGPSPASPAYGTGMTSTSGSGVHRSNTVPSKRSPAIPGARLQKNSGSPSPTAALFSPSPSAGTRGLSPAAITSEERSFTSSSLGTTPTALGISTTSAASAIASQERLLAEPGNVATPTRERNISSLFQRSPTVDTEKKQPNKLRKKRIPGSSNPSAQSSTNSLHSQSHFASPPLQPTHAGTDLVESSPLEPISSEPPAIEQTLATPPAMASPPADQSTHELATRPENIPQPSEQTLKPKSSPTSLHSSSSFNDQSDADRHDETAAADEPREKRRLFRLSRHRDTSGPSLTPRKGLGSDNGAGASATSVGSSKPRKSWTGETVPSSDSTLTPAHLHSSSEAEHTEEKRGAFGRLWSKVRENKEEREAKKERNKSPPGSNDRLASALPRGKSMDVKRNDQFDSTDGPPTPRAQQPPPR